MNLVLTKTKWKGKVPSLDKRFEQFKTLPYGIRAGILNMRHKIKNGYNTIKKLIHKWAPPHENKTANYVLFVSKRTGIGTHQVLKTDKATLKKLAKAIIQMENLPQDSAKVTDQDIEDAFGLIDNRIRMDSPMDTTATTIGVTGAVLGGVLLLFKNKIKNNA
ncbi:hypothetical protein [Aureibacter tunicatorum]|uniref:Uncharacterized protein n=1 Tax=Aureibacter tunicatorum TaxID=866807 RepID=A0AAE4BUP0_9BACT|nr:hypothetical protein [Aureibacter tunicatorum]MDR6240973.1 hypothetical protein [Aureibacter tunicatorum]BDD03752.1 hypothetical protein AUTU_12350 [Aureibacter tunicatorum]